jgi:hypothetical protein
MAVLSFARGEVLRSAVEAALGVGLIIVLQVMCSKTRLRLFVDGVERRGAFGVKRIAWSNLRAYQLQIFQTELPVAESADLVGSVVGYGLTKVLSHSDDTAPKAVILHATDGTKIALSNHYSDYKVPRFPLAGG